MAGRAIALPQFGEGKRGRMLAWELASAAFTKVKGFPVTHSGSFETERGKDGQEGQGVQTG